MTKTRLANEQLFSVDGLIEEAREIAERNRQERESEFAAYVENNWLNIGRDEIGWYVARDVSMTVRTMGLEGWSVSLTGRKELQADDSIRHYFTLA